VFDVFKGVGGHYRVVWCKCHMLAIDGADHFTQVVPIVKGMKKIIEKYQWYGQVKKNLSLECVMVSWSINNFDFLLPPINTLSQKGLSYAISNH
jgi:hypothetical protein